MNKKFMIGGCAAVAVAGNVFAGDEDYSYFNPYASLKGGYAFLGKRNDIKYKGGFAGAVELGVSYDAWRLGLELGYKSNKIKEFKNPNGFEGSDYILNGKFDFLHAPLDIHDAPGGIAAAGYVRTDNPSVFQVNDGGANGGAIVGLPGIGIAVADWPIAVGARANADHGLILRDASYLKFEKMNALTGMFNVCYDYAMTDAWSIYGGIGLGVARVNYTVTEGRNANAKVVSAAAAGVAFTEAVAKQLVLQALPNFVTDLHKTEYSKTVFAWQLMAGVGYEFTENWKLTLGYKLFNTAKVKQTFAGKEYKIKTPFNHTLEAGLTYTF